MMLSSVCSEDAAVRLERGRRTQIRLYVFEDLEGEFHEAISRATHLICQEDAVGFSSFSSAWLTRLCCPEAVVSGV